MKLTQFNRTAAVGPAPSRAVPRLMNGPARRLAGRRIAGSGSRALKVVASMTAAPAAAAGADQVAATLLQAKAGVVQLYRYPGLDGSKAKTLLRKAQKKVSPSLTAIDGEVCYNVELSEPLTQQEASALSWLLRETFEPEHLQPASFLKPAGSDGLVEVGPRMSFSTAWSTNAASICASVGLAKVKRIELSRRYLLKGTEALNAQQLTAFAGMVHDRMTEQVYPQPITSFKVDKAPEPVFTVPVMEKGRAALEEIDKKMGLAFDEQDFEYYTRMFRDEMKRDPTNVELFDIAQSNSEHSRHWYFRGKLVEDGKELPRTLFSLVKEPYVKNPNNSVVAFKDNSSAIRGFKVDALLPSEPGVPSPLTVQDRDWDLLLTAETHNFPCAVAPYPGAETGAGGRIRDTHATGIGSMMIGATAGYCVGNLNYEGYTQPWEDPSFTYPPTLASPLQILIDASNGASDYGNKFGEPLIAGYTRSFGMRLPDGERREWLKPIMFSGGIGQIDHDHLHKKDPEIGMLVVKIGGPAYRIGMGGGAASSVPSGSLDAELDFNAVQRGDAEMAQKLWRVVRACVEMGPENPIQQIHDQGAGGNCNVVKEIIYPVGAKIDIRAVKVGDETMSVMEIWGAEYQENDCILIKADAADTLRAICDRERCNMQIIGTLDGSGRVTIVDKRAQPTDPVPVDLDLEKVLGDMPDKTFTFSKFNPQRTPLELPQGETAMSALHRLLRLTDICSKRFLTNKVDRSVTGLIAQQQCVGPLHLPLADCAVLAQTHQNRTGIATSIGEQPLKGLIDPAAMARLAIGEALTNLTFAKVTDVADIRASVNWMYAAKMKSEGSAMYRAAEAMKDMMIYLGMACDGGKDSLSMAARAGNETVMAPGQFVVSAYAPCPDVTLTVTPDLKVPGEGGLLLHVDLGEGRRRLGGSALGHVYNQIGNEVPDVRQETLKAAFQVTQSLLGERRIQAGHDISDGGIAVAICEMAFAGNCGVQASLRAPTHANDAKYGPMASLYAEELGLVLEVRPEDAALVVQAYEARGVPCSVVGRSTRNKDICIKVEGQTHIQGATVALRDVWEETSFQLERLQCAEECVESEQRTLKDREAPLWRLTYTPEFTPKHKLADAHKYPVAVIREEGSNGDREMAAVLRASGLEPWDVTMSDLIHGRITLDKFRGIVFVGGFSYADVLDSAKGWASGIRFNEAVRAQFQKFYARPDVFSLGVCNGCQLMALLGWVPGDGKGATLDDQIQPRFLHNKSGRFEARFSQVRIEEGNPAVLLQGMAGSVLGVWVAHGEGQAFFPDAGIKQHILDNNMAPIRYVDDAGAPTEVYPMNPNGAPEGIAGLCSKDGRHLALMPHPERAWMTWQLPWYPKGDLPLREDGPGPWITMFQNGRKFLEKYDAEHQKH